MDKNDKIFQKALANFTFDMASRGAIRHLADLGYSAAEIRKQLDFPTPLSQIEEELQTYRAEREASEATGVTYEYIRETDAYGRTSLRRVAVRDPKQSST